jgi:endonuclease-3
MKQRFSIEKAIKLIRQAADEWHVPYLSQPHVRRDAFKTLVACIMSLRTKDETTDVAAERLFSTASTPESVAAIGEKRLAKLIYPVGFYNQKAKQIIKLCTRLVNDYNSNVPDSLEELLTFDGVGRKTANLVITEAFGKPGICVDTHVHRICNRWGYVSTKTPDQTELALREKLPKKYWLEINRLLVAYGKRRCTPVSPRCSECALQDMCPRKGVERSR